MTMTHDGIWRPDRPPTHLIVSGQNRQRAMDWITALSPPYTVWIIGVGLKEAWRAAGLEIVSWSGFQLTTEEWEEMIHDNVTGYLDSRLRRPR